MGETNGRKIGLMPWADLTVPDAAAVKEFYRRVVGWTVTEVDMGGYSDFCMNEPEGAQTVAGICHARGVNAALPPVWLVYITVADVEKAAALAVELGGTVMHGPTPMGPQGRYCVVRDPAGAVAALYEQRA